MENAALTPTYWQQRWLANDTGWDIGYVAPALQAYFDQLTDKHMRILIPGAGRGYEAEYLHRKGFPNVFVLDIAPAAVEAFRRRVPDFPAHQTLVADFFDHDASYDLIIEHTFFCALHPSLRGAYVDRCFQLLTPGGKVVGLLFDDPQISPHPPPFGGTVAEYDQLFRRHFAIRKLERAYNSIPPRKGREVFLIAQKPPIDQALIA